LGPRGLLCLKTGSEHTGIMLNTFLPWFFVGFGPETFFYIEPATPKNVDHCKGGQNGPQKSNSV